MQFIQEFVIYFYNKIITYFGRLKYQVPAINLIPFGLTFVGDKTCQFQYIAFKRRVAENCCSLFLYQN